jgi:hypothetical protein
VKVLNTIITVCFVVVFSGAAYFTADPRLVAPVVEAVRIEEPPAEVPPVIVPEPQPKTPKPQVVIKEPKPRPSKSSGEIMAEEGLESYKSFPTGPILGEKKPTKVPRQEEKKPYVEPVVPKAEPAPPPPPKEAKPIPVPEHTAMIQDNSITKNEYVRGAVGAVLGWVVKNMCELLLGLVKKLSFIKSLGW